MKTPLLSDTQTTKYTYEPGDRILVRITSELTQDQYVKVERAIKKYTREDVRVLIVNPLHIGILWKHADTQEIESLVSKEDLDLHAINPGVANLDCSVTKLQIGDTLWISSPYLSSNLTRERMYSWIRNWTGPDVELIIERAP